MSAIVELADALVAALNNGAFSLPFVAQRHYLPLFDLEALATTRVAINDFNLEITVNFVDLANMG